MPARRGGCPEISRQLPGGAEMEVAMEQYYGQENGFGETERREDKILAAKMAFDDYACSRRTYPARSGSVQREEKPQEERKHRYGLWRFVAAVVLFFAFWAGTHYQVSFRGWDSERLNEMLCDDTKWKEVVREVSSVMEHIPGTQRENEKISTE